MSSCNIKITLKRVSYQGEDIGNDWEYRCRFLPGGRWIRIPEHILDHGRTENRNDIIFNGPHGDCDTQVEFALLVWAREHDLFFDDYNRPTRTQFSFPCPSNNLLDISHSVDERFTFFGTDTAQLSFRFEIELTCA